ETPEEGYELAVKLAQKGIELIQPNEDIREMLRPVYSRNPDSLINASEVVAIHYQTVAAANNYCRRWMPEYKYTLSITHDRLYKTSDSSIVSESLLCIHNIIMTCT